jgi:ketosteroid isomerase-like protein
MKKSSTPVNKIIFFFALCISAISLQSCIDKPKEKETTVDKFDLTIAKAEIEEANKNVMTMVASGDSIGLANAFTIDAKLMSAGAPSLIGRSAIQTALSGIIKAGITGVEHRTENVYGTEDLIAEEGEITLFAGEDTVSVNKYIVLWKKEDGKWKLFRDIFNSNSPTE